MSDMEDKFLKFRSYKALKALGLYNNKEYLDRTNFELEVIGRMGFSSYYLVVADYVNWAKANDIPIGPGRGSGAGSLVAYLVGITEVDPIPWGLLFERFLNPGRMSMPDFDIDVSRDQRQKVIEYLVRTYGQDHVCQIGTLGTMKSRLAVRDVARTLGHDPVMIDEYSKLIPEEERGGQGDNAVRLAMCIDPESYFKQKDPNNWEAPTKNFVETHSVMLAAFRQRFNSDINFQRVIRLADELEGLPKSPGVHAAGIVVSNQPLDTMIPLGKTDEGSVSEWGMKPIESIGLVKFDLLGLRTLDVIDNAIKSVKELTGIDINWNEIDLEDEATYKLLQEGNTFGVFQFSEQGIGQFCAQFVPKNIHDLSAISALYRPGPKDNGMVEEVLKVRSTGDVKSWKIREVQDVLEKTDGILTFQEQILEIAKRVAGYTLAEADLLRRAIGKKLPEDMLKEEVKFIEGGLRRGHHKEDLIQLFDMIKKFADYCLVYNTKVHTKEFGLLPIGRIVEERIRCNVYSVDKNNKIYTQPIIQWHFQGIKEVTRYETETGTTITCTPDHKFLADDGKMYIMEDVFDEGLRLSCIFSSDKHSRIVNFDRCSPEPVYDIGLEKDHNFIIEHGFVASNCFNASHSYAYGVLTFRTAYLKAHYPSHFYAAELSSHDDIAKIVRVLHDAKKNGVLVRPPNINRSNARFTAIGPMEVTFGLSAIKGCGRGVVELIQRERHANGPFDDLEEFVIRMKTLSSLDTKSNNLKALALAGAFDVISNGLNRAEVDAHIKEIADFTKKEIASKARNQISLFDLIEDKSTVERKYSLLSYVYTKSMMLEDELQYLGLYVSGHPLDRYKPLYESEHVDYVSTLDLEEMSVTLIGVVSELRVKNGKRGSFCFFKLTDPSGTIDCKMWSDAYEKFGQFVKEGSVICARGKTSRYKDIDVSIENISLAERMLASFCKTGIPVSKLNNHILFKLFTATRGPAPVDLVIDDEEGRPALLYRLALVSEHDSVSLICGE